MKRSRTAALLLMSTAPLLLTACDRNESASREGLYTSVEACVAQTNDSATCGEAFAKAQQEAVATAPKFANREECEASYGKEKCAERTDGNNHSFFGPLMTGFFLSQMMRNGMAGSAFNSAPAFRDSNGGWQRPAAGASGGVYRGGTAGTGMVPINATPNRAVTTSRAGFGRSSGSRGFGS
ncbi:uncharacterized protein YgiB involved in biofilm formation [Rhodanobacter sp. TND4EL1]